MEFSDAGLAGLLVSAFVSATVLPGNSEIVLAAFLHAFPDRVAAAIAVGTLGNTLGGLTTYGIGRLVPVGKMPDSRSLRLVRRYGALALLLSWVPLAGDALCAAAGWLRIPWWSAAIAMAVGKFARYMALALALSWW